MCLSKETAQQNGREQRKKGVEGVEQEESTPKPVAAGTEKYVYFLNLPALKEAVKDIKIQDKIRKYSTQAFKLSTKYRKLYSKSMYANRLL